MEVCLPASDLIMQISDVRHIQKNKDLIIQFLPIIYAYVTAIKSCTNVLYIPRLKGGLDIALRIITGSHASFVSKSLLSTMSSMNLFVDPFDLIWEDRAKFGKIEVKNRKIGIAVWEHVIPIKMLRESLIHTTSMAEIEAKIKSYPGVAWISCHEDVRLSQLGFRQSRPDGFEECYNKAGIELLTYQEYVEFIKHL